MPQKKKQHYVPQFLLKNFADNAGKFYVFQLQKNIILDAPIPYKQQCQTDYMYGKDVQWENTLGVLETAASVAIAKIIKNECLSNSDKSVIKQFILFQYLRTEQTVENSKSIIENGLKQIIPTIADFYKLDNSKEFARDFAKKYVHTHFPRKELATSHLNMAQRDYSSLEDLRLVILKSNESFLCSDNPVILDNFFQPQFGRGYNCAGVILILPISSKYAILLYDYKVYDILSEDLYITLNPSDTWSINRTLFFYARETLFCCEKESLLKIKKYFDTIYIDNPLRKILSLLGIRDPIIANLKMAQLKESNIPAITATVPKIYANYEPLTLSILGVNSQFLPFINYMNGNFARYNKPEELEWKYLNDNPAYWEVVKKYLS